MEGLKLCQYPVQTIVFLFFFEGYALRFIICSIFRVDFAIEGQNDESVLDSITSLGDNCPKSPEVIGVPQSRCLQRTVTDLGVT